MTMNKQVKTYARLFIAFGAAKYSPGGFEDVEITSLSDIHERVRSSKDYYAYSTFQISIIHDGERDHISHAFNHSAKIKFGELKLAQDVQIMVNPRCSTAICNYTDSHPEARDTLLFVGGGRIEKTDGDDHIYDRETGKCLLPRPSLTVVK